MRFLPAGGAKGMLVASFALNFLLVVALFVHSMQLMSAQRMAIDEALQLPGGGNARRHLSDQPQYAHQLLQQQLLQQQQQQVQLALSDGESAGAVLGSEGEKTGSAASGDPDCVRHGKCVFVVATGRSGSTNVQDALNQIPGVLVRGENGGIFNLMVDVHSLVKDLEWYPEVAGKRLKGPAHLQYETTIQSKWKPAWFNAFPKGVSSCIPRMVFRKLYGYGEYSDYMVGFKEIRYMPTQTSPAGGLQMFKYKHHLQAIQGFADFERHMALLRSLCVDVKLVFNVRRDVSGQLSSGHYKAQWAEGWDKHLQTSTGWLTKYAAANAAHSFMVYHEDMFDPKVNGTVARDLLRFLGKPEETPISFARVQRHWCCD